MDTDSFIVYIKTEDIYADIAKDTLSKQDTLLPKEKNKKVIGLMKNELGRKIMKKFVELRAKK